MAPTTVLDYTTYHADGTAEAVVVRRTEDDRRPSGWDYSLHYARSTASASCATTTPTSERRGTSDTPTTA